MRRRGFTLIEISVIILVLVMVAAIAWPSLASVMKSQRIRSYLQDVERLSIDAHGIALRTGQTVSLASDGEGSFQIRQESGEGSGDVYGQVAPVKGIRVDTYRVGSDDVGGEEWEIRFFSDGTADGGGVLFAESNETWVLFVDSKTGRGRVQRGEFPDTSLTQWEAGDYVRRS